MPSTMENCYSLLSGNLFLEISVESGNTVFIFFHIKTSDCRMKIILVLDLLCSYVPVFTDYLKFSLYLFVIVCT